MNDVPDVTQYNKWLIYDNANHIGENMDLVMQKTSSTTFGEFSCVTWRLLDNAN